MYRNRHRLDAPPGTLLGTGGAGTGKQVTDATPGSTKGTSTHGWFAVIWLIYLIDYADRFAISAVLPAIKREFALTDTQLGLMSGSLFLGLAILAVPCGLAVDRFSRKYMITMMTLVWSVATWSTGLAKSFGVLRKLVEKAPERLRDALGRLRRLAPRRL